MNPSAIQDACWKDITAEFKDSVRQLNSGELLKIDRLTLFEAMSAIELMDPKMDGGMILGQTKRQILTLEQSVRMGIVKISNLESNELIGTIDDTYACLTTWLEGHSIAQTIMTNLYLHDIERIEDRCLRIFSQSILKLADFMDKLVQMVYCIEEEDFQLNCDKFDWKSKQMNDQKILTSLEDLCQHYEKLILENNNPATSGNTSNQKTKKPDHEQEQRSESGDQKSVPNNRDIPTKSQQMTAIIDRLRFTQNLYACFLIISRNLLKEHTIVGPNPAAQIQKTIKLVQSSANNCDQHLNKCLRYLDRWKVTLDYGVKPDTSLKNDSIRVEGDYATIKGFEPLINYKLLIPAYPRCPSIKTRPSTIEYLRDLVIKLKECIAISTNFYHKSFNKTLDSIEQFSKYFHPQSCVISRSFLQTLYLPNRLLCIAKDELLQSLCEYGDPLIQAIKRDTNQSLALNEFLEECSNTFGPVITIYAHNAARQHEKLPEIISSLRSLQYTAMMLSDIFKNDIVYSWTNFQLSSVCVKYILAGLELEIFSQHEYPYVFWFLYDIMYRNEKEQIQAARQMVLGGQLVLNGENNQKKNKAKKSRRKNQFNTNFHDQILLRADAFRFLTGGMFLLTYGLKLEGKIKCPSKKFTREEICFDHRFGIIIDSPLFQLYESTLARLEKLEFIYREAFECFSEAKVLFEKHGEHDNCMNVCKTNMVVAKILSSCPKTFANKEVEFCFDRHPSFPTVRL